MDFIKFKEALQVIVSARLPSDIILFPDFLSALKKKQQQQKTEQC